MRDKIKKGAKDLFTVARLKRLISAYIVSYLGIFLSFSFLAILFWSTVSSPSSVAGVIKRSGVERELIFEIAKKSNQAEIKSGIITEQDLSVAIDKIFTEPVRKDLNEQFSVALHSWLSNGRGAFSFSYLAEKQEKALKALNSNINTNFLNDGHFVASYDPAKSSIKLSLQRTYKYFWWATLVAPILFVLLALSLWYFHPSRLDLLFWIKRMFYYSSISLPFSFLVSFVYWSYLASRMESYPKASLAGAVSVVPIKNEIMERTGFVLLAQLIVYLICFILIKRYLNKQGFVKVKEKHQNDLWEYTVRVTKYYLKKVI